MNILTKTSLVAMALAGLTACGGATTGGTAGAGGSGTSPTIEPPTVTSANLVDRATALNTVNQERLTGLLPTGNGSYQGHYMGDLTGGTASANELHGTLNMTADLNFSGDRVRGSITDLNVAKDGRPVEAITGEISIFGSAQDSNGTLTATLDGNISGLMNGDVVETWEVEGAFNGSFRDKYTGRNFIGVKTYDEAALASGTASMTLSGEDTTLNSSGNWYGN